MKQYDAVAIGDALIDIFLRFHGESGVMHETQDACEVCIKLGTKVPIDHSSISLGGDACNVSVGIARLGLRSALMAEIGDDDFAEKIKKDLDKDRVNEEFLIQTKGASSTFSVIFSVTNERTIFSRHIKREHKFDFTNMSAEWIYLTSLGEDWHEVYEKTSHFVKKNPTKLAFSPGSHQLKEGRESFEEILPITDILFINREEGEKIAYGHDVHNDTTRKHIDTVLQDVKKLGPKVVSMTDGNRGSYAIDSHGEIFSQGTMPSRTVEKTGVGDAYAAAFLGAMIQGKSITEAMKWGATNSASVIEHIGATVGLLTLPQLEKKL